jgi:glycosyltransferase involved in cell wall biosynthesis
MYRNMTVSLCFPCRNEGKHLKKVLRRVPDFVDEIIIVSNKSTDNTVSVAKKLGARVFEDDRHINGIGYGYAHITGIDKAKGDIIVGADGDATYPVEDLASVIDHLLDNDLDFVSCNRYPLQKDIRIPFKLQLGVRLLNLEVRLLYGKKINDILSGMWVFKRESRNALGLTEGDWNLSPQIKINALVHPLVKFGEYSIGQYQRMGVSHQHYFKTGLSHATWIFRNRLRSKQLGETFDNSQA